jgi:hypothetical protein
MDERKRFEEITGLRVVECRWNYETERRRFYRDLMGMICETRPYLPADTIHERLAGLCQARPRVIIEKMDSKRDSAT